MQRLPLIFLLVLTLTGCSILRSTKLLLPRSNQAA
jgi:hypothetical protein